MRDRIDTNETLDILCQEKLVLVQKKGAYRFSIDAILLANFVRLKQHERLLDIGTGCGIIPVYMARKGYKNEIVGIEIQGELFELAEKNRQLNDCGNVRFVKGDIRSAPWEPGNPFHVIVSNPPYVKQHSGRRSPQRSRWLARYETLLDMSTLLSISSSLLNRKGRLYLIYPAKRLGELLFMAKSHSLEPRRLRFVHPRAGEPSNLFLVECMKEGGIDLKVEKPLYIYENEAYTPEIMAYYA